MKQTNFYSFLLVLLLGVQFSGCAVFLLGAGAAGGYAISKDEIEGHTDQSFEKTWNALVVVINSEGGITLKDKTTGKIEAQIKESDVKASLEQITPKTVRVRIKARKTKGVFPDIELAQELYTKLIKKIE